MIIPVAHDFSCPWCWIGLYQAIRLKEEFGAEIEWLAYEIYPEDMEYDTAAPRLDPPDKPPTPTRMQLAYAAQGMQRPTNRRPGNMRSHKAHEAVEFAKTEGGPNALVESIYRAYYEQAADIDNVQTLVEIARPHIKNIDGMLAAIQERRFAEKIIAFDEPAYQTGVYNVPTFFIGGERYAEQPYVVLQKAMRDLAVTV